MSGFNVSIDCKNSYFFLGEIKIVSNLLYRISRRSIERAGELIKSFDSDIFPDVALALAASALAWEIAIQSDAILEEKFSFQDAMKDIYLSLGSHDVRTKGGNEHH